ncbi:MAG: type I DNA topoisomerase [Verrucomicrobiota bacterium]
MAKKLVIVESPTKARTISRFLKNGDSEVAACMGHIRDLPQKSLGVDISGGFQPQYEITPNGRKSLKQLKESAKKADEIYLAPDPDREGEAIAWHLQEELSKVTDAPFYRVTFHEITQDAIRHSFENPESIDTNKVDAQQARRILDRIVGYKVSPLLWRHIQKGASAGRVQTVALKFVCEREREIQKFVPQEYWNLTATFQPDKKTETFKATLARLDGEKPDIPDGDTAKQLTTELEQSAQFLVHQQKKKNKKQRPYPPFTTSTLQQAAGGLMRFTARQTMSVAQQLYEGMDLGEEGATGLITYMRTDSVAVAGEAQEAARGYINETYGSDYVPSKPNRYKSGKGAQEAHEAIRPTDVTRTPEKLAAHLNQNQLKLYRLIWHRFVASQMAPAKIAESTIEVSADNPPLKHSYLFRATVSETLFPGFKKVYDQIRKSSNSEENKQQAVRLPEIEEGTSCNLKSLDKEQKFTEPPKRYTEATLVRELERKGVGRPSTYATTVHTIQQRGYVERQKGALIPTELGLSVNDYLIQRLPHLFQVKFTADMESELDQIEEGELDYKTMLDHFYQQFRKWVKNIESIPAPEKDTIEDFIDSFPDDIAWEKPVTSGNQKYDDKKFFESLRSQVKEKDKKLTDKQWQALLAIAAKYSDKLPQLKEKCRQMGIEEEMEMLIGKDGDKASSSDLTPPPSEETIALIKALKDITNWEKPQPSQSKQGSNRKKAFDDHNFYESVRKRVENNTALTLAQKKALRNLVVKYRDQIPNFEELSNKYGLNIPEPKEYAGGENTAAILELFDHISKWQEPQKRKSRTYDDKKFAESLKKQFGQKGGLTVKQLAAAKRILAKYHEQIPDYENKAEELQLPAPGSKEGNNKNQVLETNIECPRCGKNLIIRRGHRGKFYGCSAFPECRYTKALKTDEERS